MSARAVRQCELWRSIWVWSWLKCIETFLFEVGFKFKPASAFESQSQLGSDLDLFLWLAHELKHLLLRAWAKGRERRTQSEEEVAFGVYCLERRAEAELDGWVWWVWSAAEEEEKPSCAHRWTSLSSIVIESSNFCLSCSAPQAITMSEGTHVLHSCSLSIRSLLLSRLADSETWRATITYRLLAKAGGYNCISINAASCLSLYISTSQVMNYCKLSMRAIWVQH